MIMIEPNNNKSRTVTFRLSAEEYTEAERIAQMASSHGRIRNDSVNTLAKACLFVRINEWRRIEYQQEVEKAKEALRTQLYTRRQKM